MEERYDRNLVNHLLECIKGNAGDKESVIRLYEIMYKPVYYIALGHLKMLRPSWKQNYADAQDIAGDTFVEILRKIDKFRFAENAPGWIFKITERLAKKFVSKRKSETTLEPETADNKAESSLENKVIVADILNRLNPHELEIVFLHYYFDYTYSEISAIIEKSESSIKQTMANIKKRNKIDDDC